MLDFLLLFQDMAANQEILLAEPFSLFGMGSAGLKGLGYLAGGVGRSLGGLFGGDEDQSLTGFGGGPDFFPPGHEVDEQITDPRYQVWHAAEGMGRLGNIYSKRAETPFLMDPDPLQQPVGMTGGMLPFPVALSATDPANYRPNDRLMSKGMNVANPFGSRIAGHVKEAGGHAAQAPTPPSEAMGSHPSMARMDAGLALMGINRDKEGNYAFSGTPFGDQQLFRGAQGGQHRIPGSPERPFGEGKESQRVGSQPTRVTPPTGGTDIRRKRGSGNWSA
jgi:hypothetical protein